MFRHSAKNITCFYFQMTDVEQETDSQVDQARKQIKDWLNKPMRISIVDGRVLVGVLLCTDREQNLIFR